MRVGVAVDTVVVGVFVGVEPRRDLSAGKLVAGRGVGFQRPDVGAAPVLRERSHSTPPFMPDAHGGGVRPETLGLGHGDDGRGEGRKPLAREFLIGDLAQERVGVHAAVSPRPAARGQRVVGSRGVIPGAFGRPGADEDASGGGDLRRDVPGVAHRDDQVLGGVGVGEGDHLLAAVEHHDAALAERFADGVAALKLLQLLFDGAPGVAGETFRGADQHRLAVASVFGLREEVGGGEVGRRFVVGQHEHLRGARREIDGHVVWRRPAVWLW